MRIPALAVLATAAFLAWTTGTPAQTQPTALFARVQQLVNAGNRPGAYALADSALALAIVGTDAHAEALYSRAFATANAGAAERDYSRLVAEYPRSPRLEDALFMSGQFRMARGDRAGARKQLERLVLEFASGPNATRAALWGGKLALDDGDLVTGCRLLAEAGDRAGTDVELRNEIQYARARCVALQAAASDSAKKDSVPPALADSTEFSVQVAAFARRTDATALSRRLTQRGFQARVVGAMAPFRVRVGRYGTRELATSAAARMERAGVHGIVVEAEGK